MNKAIIPILLLLSLIIACSGCVFDDKDPIVGIWVSGEYTNLAGTHYTKMVENFTADQITYESLYTDDGNVVHLTSIWINRGNNKYDSYYSPIMFNIHPILGTAELSSDLFIVDSVELKHLDSNKGILGKWRNTEPVEIMDDIYYLEIDITNGGKGTITHIKNDMSTKGSSVLSCDLLGDNMYAITLTEAVKWNIGADGNLYDNYNNTYVKQL